MTERVDFMILGAGLAGTMMARVLHDHYPDKRILTVDARPTPDTKNHWALLRFRDLDVARALGVGVEEVEVEKAVYWRGQLHYTADCAMNNMYSLKAYGQIGRRSLQSLGMAKRYLPITTPRPPGAVLWGATVVDINLGHITFQRNESLEVIAFDTCVSTLPLHYMAKIAKMDVAMSLLLLRLSDIAEPIGVWRKTVNIPCKVNQTIYFPDPSIQIYRATLERQQFIAEYLVPEDPEDDFFVHEIPEVVQAFGINWSRSTFDEIDLSDFHTQPIGKMLDIDDELRRRVIYELTDRFNIYSVGRFATWRPLRADQLVKDVYKVERMIRQGIGRTRYERRLNASADSIG